VIEDVHFVTRDLRAIDASPAEVIACTTFCDERPLRGVAGLLDWRLAGRLSTLAKSGFLVGKLGEVLLVPGRPQLPFEKVVVLGLGDRAAFDDAVVARTLERLASTLDGLKVKRALVELPGRASGVLEAKHAAELLLEHALEALEQEAWTFVDTPEAEASMTERLLRRVDARSRPSA
jgi:hypothetical protein